MRPVFFVLGIWTVISGAGAFSGSAQATTRSVVKTKVTAIPPEVTYELTRTVGPGRLVKVQDGEPGEVKKTIRVIYKGNRAIRSEVISIETRPAVPTIFHMGKTSNLASRGSFVRGKVLEMTATAYDPSAGRGRYATGITASGLPAQFGVVAVDPRVIPLGTRVFVEGYGFAIAADKGSAIKGHKIDLCFPTRRECMQFGRRKVRVHVLKGR
jgi:3D (Asp-Asp-Asp) domain-containing protein